MKNCNKTEEIHSLLLWTIPTIKWVTNWSTIIPFLKLVSQFENRLTQSAIRDSWSLNLKADIDVASFDNLIKQWASKPLYLSHLTHFPGI